ncbi:hypothetical protein SAY87_024880 [Trapa incisa]|uniref:K-box domain-containing protein n=1 Tax=Trapa incisa TaxID=236973 RepID=A0AAN7JFR6_9MYRT|nr:hypothetical protein SAY87_024880 [Trapa incisa]
MDEIFSMEDTIDRYMKQTIDRRKEDKNLNEQEIQLLKRETFELMEKIELLEASKRKLLGGVPDDCSIEELQQIEQQLELSVGSVRSRKVIPFALPLVITSNFADFLTSWLFQNQLFKEQIEQLKEKEKTLCAENALLLEKCGVQRQQEPMELLGRNSSSSLRDSSSGVTSSDDVETELFIGPPVGR